MASLHKHQRSKYWYCAFVDGNGRAASRSTRQTDKKLAMRICVGYEELADKARTKQLSQRQVRKVMGETIEKAGGEPPVTYTIENWFRSWVLDVESSKASGTADRYSALVDEFLESLGRKAKADLTYLSMVDIQTFRDRRVKDGISNNSADLLLKTLRTCLNVAVKQKHIDANPAEAVSLLGKDASIKDGFSREEVKRLVQAAGDEEWKGLIKAGYYSGGRLGDCARFTFEQIDLEKFTLKFTPKKQKRAIVAKSVEIPLHPEFLSFILKRRKSSGPIFPTLAKKRVGGKTGLSLTFRAIIDAAGIKYTTKLPRGDKGRKVHSLGFHSLRHSFNSDLANAQVSQEIRQKLMGQASRQVNDGYTKIEMETFRQAIATLPPLESENNSPSN